MATPGTLSSILNVPKLEQVFSQLLTRLATQEAEIGRLREQLEGGAVEKRLKAVEDRLAAQEAQCQVPESTSTIGRCVSETRAALARLADAVDTKADFEMTQQRLDQERRETAAKLQTLKEETAELEYARSLEVVAEGLAERLDAAELKLRSKLDVGDAAKIKASCDRLKTADRKLEHCLDKIGDHDTQFDTARQERQSLRDDVTAGLADAKAERDSIQRTLTKHHDDLDRLDGLRSRHEKRLTTVETEGRRLEATMHSRFETAAKRTDDAETLMQRLAIANRADMAKLSKAHAADRNEMNAKFSAVATDLDKKTAVKIDVAIARLHDHALAQLKNRTSALEDAKVSMTDRLDVALRFVDWFAHRGSAYEHNMTALDRRLSGMVLGDPDGTTSIREPYSANVRVTT